MDMYYNDLFRAGGASIQFLACVSKGAGQRVGLIKRSLCMYNIRYLELYKPVFKAEGCDNVVDRILNRVALIHAHAHEVCRHVTTEHFTMGPN